MEGISEYTIKLTFEGQSSIVIPLRRSYIPFTSKRLLDSLPIRGRAIKRDGKLILTTPVKGKNEALQSSFKKYDLSLHGSSGSISLYLEDVSLPHKETYLGKVPDDQQKTLEELITHLGLTVDLLIEKVK
ncbi:MAG: hypothetical protein D6732_13885 [Methanobacteriota archaeon]|nr:MAG: hypothetical protein D6732_13885 [Euryarchaeota archaeon]